MYFKLFTLLALLLVFLYGILLKAIQRRSENNPVPENAADVYDQETYIKWRSYHSEKNRLGMLEDLISFIPAFCAMAFNLYAAFAGLFPKTPFMQLAAVLLLSVMMDLFTIPCSYYDTMVIEEKYGFNRSSKKTFWLDQIKGLAISLVLMILVTSLLMAVHQALDDWLVPVFAGALICLTLLISFLYPFFSRIFNQFTPLEEGELKEKLSHLLEKHGYHVRAIQIMNASLRSTKSNAYFTGFGKTKTIVLYDTLVQSMTPDEICAVFAHEMGHGLHKDTLKNQAMSTLQMIVLSLLSWLTLKAGGLFPAFGFEGINYGFAVILIMSVEFALISPLFSLAANAFSRKAEYRADAQAVAEGYAVALISALKKLSRENFADLSPDPLLVKLKYSHPTLSQRIDAIESKARKTEPSA